MSRFDNKFWIRAWRNGLTGHSASVFLGDYLDWEENWSYPEAKPIAEEVILIAREVLDEIV